MNTMHKLNGANSAMLARITGRPIATEARPLTTSFDLVKKNQGEEVPVPLARSYY